MTNSSCLYTSTHGKCRAAYLIITYRTPPPTPLIIALYLLDNQTSLNLHRWSTQDLAQQLITTLWWSVVHMEDVERSLLGLSIKTSRTAVMIALHWRTMKCN